MENITDKYIKNEQWSVKQLASKVSSKEISKPKYQRKRKWDTLPKKENVPSEKDYIDFLYETNNSVHAITFGQNGKELSNIDGNNRINAILHFLEEPFCLFPEKLDKLLVFIKNQINKEVSCDVEIILKKMKYCELMTFKYNRYFIENGHVEIYNSHLKSIRDELEPCFDELMKNMKINGKDRFDTDVKINVNLFDGYTIEELADIFCKINKYKSGLTEQEILASQLYKVTTFTITDKLFELELKGHIKQFYLERTEDEVLTCYTYDENKDIINAYDFMVGFQNYSHNKCSLIDKTDNDGLSLFFKIYKTIYKIGFDISFTTENVNEFIFYISKTISLLEQIKTNIFMEKLVGNGKIFDGCNKKLSSLKKNNMYLIIIAIIGYIKNNTPEDNILRSIEKCLVFHFFVNGIEDKEKREAFQLHDSILYQAGGAFIDNKAKDFLKTPTLISDKINKEIMTEVVKYLNNENIKNKLYETRANGKDKNDKRRSRKIHEKFLIYYYYTNKVPREFLKNTFWVEHLFPFSSSWDNEIDIDRLGNIIPIIDTLNKERSNKHINEYRRLDKSKFLKYIDIIPQNQIYDEIVTHKDMKPHIHNSEKYNDFCCSNETILINCFLEHLFN